jgi:hypothetical protein
MTPASTKGNVRTLLWRAIAAWYELGMLIPIFMLIHQEHSDFPGYSLLFGAAALSALAAAMSLKLRVFWIQALTAAAVLALAVVFALQTEYSLAVPLAIAAGFGFLQGVTIPWRMDNVTWYMFGVLAYFFPSALAGLVPEWKGLLLPLLGGGLFYLATTLFAANRRLMADITFNQASNRIPADFKRYNRIIVTVILAIMLLLAAFIGPSLASLLKDSLGFLLRGISSGAKPTASQEPAPTQQPANTEALPPPGKGSLWAHLLDELLIGILFLLLAAAVIWALYRLYRRAPEYWKRLLGRLLSLLRLEKKVAPSAGFTDEETSLFSWNEALGRLKNRINLTRPKEPDWSELPDNRERVRYAYRRWLRKQIDRGYRQKLGLTPLETEQDVLSWLKSAAETKKKAAPGPEAKTPALIRLYNLVRYGEQDPSDDEVSGIR